MKAGCQGSCRQGRGRCDCDRAAQAPVCVECFILWVVFVPLSWIAVIQFGVLCYRFFVA